MAIALVARLLVLGFAIEQHGVTWLYSRGLEVGFVADSLLRGHGFSSPFGGETGPTALIAPGYPLLVAVVFKLFGLYSRASALIIMLAQIAANLVTIVFIMQLARKLAGETAAVVAGFFWSCWIPLLWMPTIFWETSLSACVLPGMLLLAIHVVHHPRRSTWLLFGFFCGLFSLINMALLITLGGMLLWMGAMTFRVQKVNAVLAACLFLITFSPWPIRNAKDFHAFVPLRTTVGLELWMGNHEGSSGYLEQSMFPVYNHAELDEYLRVGELSYDHEKSSIAHSWIGTHKLRFAKLTGLRFLRFWMGSGTRNGSLIFLCGAFLTSVAGFVGLMKLYRRGHRRLVTLFVIPLVCFPLPYYITHAEFRYRLVLDPLLTVLAVYAFLSKGDEVIQVSPATGMQESAAA